MNTVPRLCTVAFALLLLAPWCRSGSWSQARAETIRSGSDGRILVGELVVTNAARNQFRLVDQGGVFTVPMGMSVEALSGKPVEVELGPQGRVVSIAPKEIEYVPITDGEEIISGELVMRDPATRAFAIAGDDGSFVAPVGDDLTPYVGRVVTVRIDDRGQVKSVELAAAGALPPLNRCRVGAATVADGSTICHDSTTFRCRDGEWVRVGGTC